ncbi:VPS9 domain-containing protein 1 isoform X2 [Hippocampus zosterae]|uniref:VPS9 domain-containing protein 1 isoform X2 n=1 Tax=Hippocampus zosterae TaxID=109293 RepID=UPI00223D961E|nr:VPS9 domain-containing protein 1 isoform X2 [Hippocampus zosterae]
MAIADQKTLQTAMKMAKVAIHLDGGNRHKEAYCEYLRTINYISHALLEEAVAQTSEEKEMLTTDMERMLTLAEQCLERAKSFLKKTADPFGLACPSYISSSDSDCHQTADLPVKTINNTALSGPPVDIGQQETSPTNTCQHQENECSPFLPPEVFQRLQNVELDNTKQKELTPIEEASRLNQKLKANYEARLARLKPGQAFQKTSLVERKMEERRLRLEEEANRRFAASGAMTPEEQEQCILYTNVLEYEHNHDWLKQWKVSMKKNPDDITLVSGFISNLLSCSDHPVVKLLKKHQYRIYNRLYPIVSKGFPASHVIPPKTSNSTHNHLHPEPKRKPDRTVSNDIDNQSFTTDFSLLPFSSNAPNKNYDDSEGLELKPHMIVDREYSFEDLGHFLNKIDWAPLPSSTEDSCCNVELSTGNPTQQEVDDEHFPEMKMRTMKQHLEAIVKDIHIAIDQLLSLCLLSCEYLNTADYKDMCLRNIEMSFFVPLWSALVALFRMVHKERELALQIRMKLYQDVLPGDFGVPLKLFPHQTNTPNVSYPYECAVQELKLLTKDCCPHKKLECIVRTLRLICSCAEEYRCLDELNSAPKTAAIGADDLLPILSFVVLRCQCPQIVSECAALEEFIHEGFLIGEEGYCLTSMQSALAFVESMHIDGFSPPPERFD